MAESGEIFFNDTGVLRMMAIRPKVGLLAENAVYLKLLREGKNAVYYDVKLGKEVDFVDGERVIEVKYRDDIEEELKELDEKGENMLVVVPEVKEVGNRKELENIELVSLGEFLM